MSRRACMQCFRDHKKCDGKRPCERCTLLGRGSECCDKPRAYHRRDMKKKPTTVPAPITVVRKERKKEEGSVQNVYFSAPPSPGPDVTEVFSIVARLIIHELKRRPELFVAKFGIGFMENFELKVLSRGMEELSFLDEWSLEFVGVKGWLGSIAEDSVPTVIHRMPSVFDHLHQRHLLHTFEPPYFATNDAFVNVFGIGDESVGRKRKHVDPDGEVSIIRKRNPPPISLDQVRELLKRTYGALAGPESQKYWEEPVSFELPVHSMRQRGEIVRKFRATAHVLRSPLQCPVFMVVKRYPATE